MVFVFLVVYTDDKVNECISRIDSLSLRLFPGEAVTFIIADTSKQTSSILNERVVFIYPGNTGREFGGWDSCFRYMNSNMSVDSDDKVIIANDTFYSNYGDDYLSFFEKQSYELLEKDRAIYGYMDAFPQAVEINNNKFNDWVRTSFFISNIRTLNSVNLFNFPYKANEFFSNDSEFFLSTGLLSENYKKYLKCWLFSNAIGDDEFCEKWHSAKILSDDTQDFMQAKAMCIFSEHYLTWHARESDVQIIKVNI